MKNRMIRLVLVEDDPQTLAALRKLFSTAEDFSLVGAHESAELALLETNWREVDVLLTDLDLPGLTGAQLIAVARGQAPELLALAHTMHENRVDLFAALRAGASGYLVKGTGGMDVIQSIHAMHQGETPISPAVARHLVAYFHAAEQSQSATENELTGREHEVLRRFAEGSTYDEIAGAMGISYHTVHSHVRKIYEKLQVNSRKQAIRLALDRGYVKR